MIFKKLLLKKTKKKLEKIVNLKELLSHKKILSMFVNSDIDRNFKVVKTDNLDSHLYEDKLFLFFNRLKADSIITTVI